MDLQHLRASDGTGEAVLAHIQTVRNPGSTVLDLDNVDNWNTKAVIITGTPAANGFVSPVGMKVMYGHLSAGDFIIDGYAPGYVDNGNTTAEVAIVKMTTSWADTLIDLLDNSLQDNGLLKVTSLDHFRKPSELSPYGFIASGGVIAISAGLIGTFSNIVYYIAGLRYAKTGVANKTYTASKDTYVDIDAAGTVTYTEVANGAAAPALAANSLRLAKVITSGVAITSIVQNTSDSLGNIIYPVGAVSARSIQNPVKFSVYRAAALNSSGSETVIPFDTKLFDTGNNVDIVTNQGRFTAPVAGYYMFNGNAGNTAAASTPIYTVLYKNGVGQKAGTVHTSSQAPNYSHVSGLIQLNAGDYVDLRFVGGGGSVMGIGQINCYFDGFMISAS